MAKRIASGRTSKATTTTTAKRRSPSRAAVAGAPSSAPQASTPLVKANTTPAPISAAQRREMVATLAYLRAEHRGFVNGDSMADWLEAEREVDARMVVESAEA